MVLDNIEATFDFWPLYKLSWDPRFPVQDVTQQHYDMVILGPVPT